MKDREGIENRGIVRLRNPQNSGRIRTDGGARSDWSGRRSVARRLRSDAGAGAAAPFDNRRRRAAVANARRRRNDCARRHRADDGLRARRRAGVHARRGRCAVALARRAVADARFQRRADRNPVA